MAGKNSDDKVRCSYVKEVLFIIGVIIFFCFFVTTLDNLLLSAFDSTLLYMWY